jgi:hypothetical protein
MDVEKLSAEASALRMLAEAKVAELVAAIKTQEATEPAAPRPGPDVHRLTSELHAINARLGGLGKLLQDAAGVTEEDLDAIEQASLPSYDERWWRHQIVAAPPSEYLDDFTPKAVEALLQRVDGGWLKEQAARSYRLDRRYLSMPLHIVAGTRMPQPDAPLPPQRFAHMLLVAIDHLDKRDDLDFFAAASFVPEITALGCRLDHISALGAEATRKFARLPVATSEEVPSMIYELLVGTACVLRGREIEMLPASGSAKSPDFRLHNMHAPVVLECKRRYGLTQYELDEAAAIERLYVPLREIARAKGLHGTLEIRFRVPVMTVEPRDLIHLARPILEESVDAERTVEEWGSLAYRRLPFGGDVPDTRLYSPDYLKRVFAWSTIDNDWDGLMCEVQPPERVRVKTFRLPFCLKWRSDSPEALTKKARGITSLWAKAVKQVPPGEIGFIYIAYPEGQRAELADARTRHIAEMSQKLWHRWSIRVPVTVVARLYARPLGAGVPDLIEAALPAASKGEAHWLAQLPGRVFFCGDPRGRGSAVG